MILADRSPSGEEVKLVSERTVEVDALLHLV